MNNKNALSLLALFSFLLGGCSIGGFINNNSLQVSELPVKTKYVVGEKFNSLGLEITDQNETRVNDYTLYPADGTVLNDIGDITVTVSKTNYKSTSFTINVREEHVDPPIDEELIAAKENAKDELDEYYLSFDLDEYNATGKEQLKSIYEKALKDVDEAEDIETVEQIVADAKKAMNEVSKREVDGIIDIEVIPPSRLNYTIGDKLDLDGIAVFAIYEDNSKERVINYKVDNVDTSSSGIKTVKVGYKEFSKSFNIEVKEKINTGSFTIDIYATNDIHGQILEESNRAGIGKTMSYLKNVKNGNTLLLDQGDTWQGSFYSNDNRGALINDVMNYVKYDSRTIGNHDFDWGQQFIKTNKETPYNGYMTPVLGANIYDFNFVTKQVGNVFQSDLARKTITYTLNNGVKVGIVGVIGRDQISSIMSKYVEDVTFIDHVQVLKDESTRLRNEGCDVVIASVHGGQEDVLNQGLSGYVDLVLCGHTHNYETSVEDGVYFGQFGSYTSGVGHFALTYNASDKKVSNTTVEYIRASTIKNIVIDGEIQSIIGRYAEQMDSKPDDVVAKSVSGSFYSNEELPNLMCKAIYYQAKKEGVNDIILSCCNYARYSLTNKTFWTYADLYQAFPFDNEIYIIEASKDEIVKEVGYNYTYRSPDFDGILNTNRKYKIACIDFLAFHTNVNRYYDYFKDNNGAYVGKLSLTYREVLKNYLKDAGYADSLTLKNNMFVSSLAQHFKSFNTNMVKLEFYSNYGDNELIQYQYVNVGDYVSKYYPEVNPKRDGYTFSGWCYDVDGTRSANGTSVSSQNEPLKIYASWSSGDPGGGDIPDPNKGKSISNPFTVTEAISHINENGDDGNIYYVKGTITGSIYKSSYGENSYRFEITDGAYKFTAYYVNVLVSDYVPNEGDEVIISGRLMLYNNSIYETASGTGSLEQVNK